MRTGSKFSIIMIGLGMACAGAEARAEKATINFGAPEAEFSLPDAPTNNLLCSGHSGCQLSNLKDDSGANTGYAIEVTQSFAGAKVDGGAREGHDQGAFEDAALRSYFYTDQSTGVLTLKNLNADRSYTVTLIGSRSASSGTRYTVYEINSVEKELQVIKNFSQTVTFSNLQPDASGEIEIAVRNRDFASQYGYINALSIESDGDAEPNPEPTPDPTPTATAFQINVNVGAETQLPLPGASWNNFLSSGALGSSMVLHGEDGEVTGVAIEITQAFTGSKNDGGHRTGDDSGPFPDNALRSYLYAENSTGVLTFKNLPANLTYTLTTIGSRSASTGERRTAYTVGDQTQVLQTQRNSRETVTFSDLVPDSSGQIHLKIRNADSASVYGYVNGVILVGALSDSVPEPDPTPTPTPTPTPPNPDEPMEAGSLRKVPKNSTPEGFNGPTAFGYYEYLPVGYSNPGTQKYPVVVFLSGYGERGTGSLSSLDQVTVAGPLKLVKNGSAVQKQLPFLNAIVIAPQDGDSRFYGTDITRILDYVEANYHVGSNSRVDTKRIYLTGLSAGGISTWNAVTNNVGDAQRFAAIVPISARKDVQASYACRLGNVPVWAFHGENDFISGSKGSREALDKIWEDCPDGHDSTNTRFTVYPNTGHDAWTRTYDDPEMWDWMFSWQKP